MIRKRRPLILTLFFIDTIYISYFLFYIFFPGPFSSGQLFSALFFLTFFYTFFLQPFCRQIFFASNFSSPFFLLPFSGHFFSTFSSLPFFCRIFLATFFLEPFSCKTNTLPTDFQAIFGRGSLGKIHSPYSYPFPKKAERNKNTERETREPLPPHKK